MRKEYLLADELVKASGGSVYRLAILTAKRALQLADGDKPLVNKDNDKVLDIVLREIDQDKIKMKE